eukprot:4525382-Alexandrium_andersonii.AAC.1
MASSYWPTQCRPAQRFDACSGAFRQLLPGLGTLGCFEHAQDHQRVFGYGAAHFSGSVARFQTGPAGIGSCAQGMCAAASSVGRAIGRAQSGGAPSHMQLGHRM